MTTYLVFGLIIVLSVTLIAFTPNKVQNVDETIKLVSLLGTSTKIPTSEITIIPSPIKADTKFTRVCGVKVGEKMSGIYRDKEGHYYRLFVTGTKQTIFFKYKERIYIVDSWKDNANGSGPLR